MKRLLFTLSALLALGLALANGPGDEYDVGEDEAQVTERITLTIPQRVALHLTEDEWVLDLNNPPLGENGEGCFLVPKGYEGTLEDAIEDALLGELEPMDAYPAAKDLDGNGSLEDSEKGTLLCINRKVLQKFCNNGDGCELDLKVTRTRGDPTYGKLGVKDVAEDIEHKRFVEIIPGVNDDGDPLELLKVLGERLPGWLDDIIIEAFWFDGSEVAGEYEFNFLFQLAAL